jgi:hypothetical protein
MRRRRTGQQCLHQHNDGKRPSHPIRRGAGDPMPTQFCPGALPGAAEASIGYIEGQHHTTTTARQPHSPGAIGERRRFGDCPNH